MVLINRNKIIIIFYQALLFLAVLSLQPLAAEEIRFVLSTDNTVVIDNKTGLMWPANDNGSDISWPAAREYCQNYRVGEYSDWRMPTQDELATLYDLKAAEKSDYYIVSRIQISACCLWAVDSQGPKVASFDFEYGNREWGYPMSTGEARALPVRNAR